MRLTTRFLRTLLPALIVATLATPYASAQSTLNIPFNFVVNGKTCPPGTYTAQKGAWGAVVALQGNGQSFIWLLRSGKPSPDDKRVILTFGRRGARYTLRTVQYQSQMTDRLDTKATVTTSQDVAITGN